VVLPPWVQLQGFGRGIEDRLQFKQKNQRRKCTAEAQPKVVGRQAHPLWPSWEQSKIGKGCSQPSASAVNSPMRERTYQARYRETLKSILTASTQAQLDERFTLLLFGPEANFTVMVAR